MILPADVPAGRARRGRSARRAASCCAGAEVFDVYTGAQAGEGRRSLAFALTFRARRPHADRRGRRARARADRRARCATSWEVSCVGETVLVAGGVGLRGRARRAASCTAIRTSSSPPSPRASDVGVAARRPLPAPPRAAGARGARPRPPRRRRRGDRRLPARRVGARRRRAARRGVRVVDLSADFRLRDRATYERVVRRARGAGAVRHRRLRAARALPRADRRGRPRRRPGLLPDRRAARASRRSAATASSPTSSSTRRPASPARAAARTQKTHFVTVDENVAAVRGRRATATRRRSTRSCARAGAPVDGDVHPAPAAARPGRAAVLLRHDDAAVEQAGAATSATPRAYADEPFVELTDRAARRPRRARDEPVPHPGPRRAADGQGPRLRAPSTTSGRARPRRPCSR